MDGQYLNQQTLFDSLTIIDVDTNELGRTDTYHEKKIVDKLLKIEKLEYILIYKAAIQIAVIGAGNKNYGFVRDSNNNVIQLKELFKRNDILWDNKQDSKLQEDTLTARRIVRVFRYQIQRFIKDKNMPSYLWTKYANKDNKDFAAICFPGAEHLIETKEEAKFLADTYSKLDQRFNSLFLLRLNRVFIARNIIQPNEAFNIK